tara:strand:- start:51 stop:491 length:441 start_codon:yes stop_codon:yes gene_type:complete
MGVANSTARNKDYMEQVDEDIEESDGKDNSNKNSSGSRTNDNKKYLDDFTKLLDILKKYSELNSYDNKFVVQNKSIMKEIEEKIVKLKNKKTGNNEYYITNKQIYKEKEKTNENYEFLTSIFSYTLLFLGVVIVLLLSIKTLNYKV